MISGEVCEVMVRPVEPCAQSATTILSEEAEMPGTVMVSKLAEVWSMPESVGPL